MKLAIGNDHTAVDLKRVIVDHLEARGVEVVNVGTDSTESFDYPVSGYRVGKLVAEGEVDGGVLICGTGVGISLAANKVKGCYAACIHDVYQAERAQLSNMANVITMGSQVIGINLAKALMEEYLANTWDPECRSFDKVQAILDYEAE